MYGIIGSIVLGVGLLVLLVILLNSSSDQKDQKGPQPEFARTTNPPSSTTGEPKEQNTNNGQPAASAGEEKKAQDAGNQPSPKPKENKTRGEKNPSAEKGGNEPKSGGSAKQPSLGKEEKQPQGGEKPAAKESEKKPEKPAPQGGKKPAAKEPEKSAFPPVDVTAEAAREKAVKGLSVKGSVAFDTRTETGFNSRTTYHQWKADVVLENGTGLPLELGSDLLLLEVNSAGSDHEGVGVFNDSSPNPVTGPSSYGLYNSYELRGMVWLHGGTFTNLRFGGVANPTYGTVPEGKSWTLSKTFEQMTWLRDDLRAGLTLVLPEVRVRTTHGMERFRVLVYFQKPEGFGGKWKIKRQQVIAVRPAELTAILEGQENTASFKILAANWLAEAYPKEAVRPLVALGKTLTDGQLCATCLDLLAVLKGDGLGEHAVALLKNKQRANGIRNRAAIYLGAVKYGPGLEPLTAAAKETDNAVANGAIAGLGSFGGPRPVKVLLAMLRSPLNSYRHRLIASSLLKTGDPGAIKAVKDLARKGNAEVTEALIAARLPGTFDFFVDLAKKATDQTQRDRAARGLRATGGEKAVPVLLKMLEKESPPTDYSVYSTTEVVRQLADVLTPEVLPRVVELARKGNLRAVQVLASSRNKLVREPLIKLAEEAKGPVLRIILNGLQTHWAKDSVKVFARHLNDSDPQVVQAAVNGLNSSQDPGRLALLVPLLKHKDRNVRSTVVYAVTALPLGEFAPQVADALSEVPDENLVNPLVSALMRAKWKDPKYIPKLGKRLAATKGYSQFDLIRLLRYLSDDAMGPRDYNEYSRDPQGWARKWVEWAARK